MIGILNIFGVMENVSKIIGKIKDNFSFCGSTTRTRKWNLLNRMRNLRNMRDARRSKPSEAIEQRTNPTRSRNRKSPGK